jgi:hypothetical protein
LTDASDDECVGIAILVTVLILSPIIIMLVKNAVATIQVCVNSIKINGFAFYANIIIFFSPP